MSSAFVRERDDQWLHEISPTINSLIVYLTRENNGLVISVKKIVTDSGTSREVYQMSDGLAYFINEKGQWDVL